MSLLRRTFLTAVVAGFGGRPPADIGIVCQDVLSRLGLDDVRYI